MIMQDCLLLCRQIAEKLRILIEITDNILAKEHGSSKVSAKWVSRLWTSEQKHTNTPCALCPRVTWTCLKLMRIFLFVLLLWMKVLSITANPKPKNNQTSGSTHIVVVVVCNHCILLGQRNLNKDHSISRAWLHVLKFDNLVISSLLEQGLIFEEVGNKFWLSITVSAVDGWGYIFFVLIWA